MRHTVWVKLDIPSSDAIKIPYDHCTDIDDLKHFIMGEYCNILAHIDRGLLLVHECDGAHTKLDPGAPIPGNTSSSSPLLIRAPAHVLNLTRYDEVSSPPFPRP
mmetsp:Transcript_41106/g.99697  ORF Transcript_41106/g.99697 Transcript_41106/m.99697 type:complete len:104 (+) Transcript_41106:401-712(+)